MIGVIGLNHKSSPISIREYFALSDKEILELLKKIKCDEIPEVVILSTCNRTEVYFYSTKKCRKSAAQIILNKIKKHKKINENIKEYFYTFKTTNAVLHLLKVAAGLNSMVLGENQVLGQVKNAYRLSAENKYTGLILNRLFHKAIEAGKKVRTETEINKGASSISYAAVELMAEAFKDISDKKLLLVGAGETGELVLQSLSKRGAKKISVINRTLENAKKLAKIYKATVYKFQDLEKILSHSDIVITAAYSPEMIITEKLIENILKKKGNDKKLFFIDISVPRCIDESIKNHKSVFLYNLDDLKAVVSKNYSKRENEIEKAEKIIDKIMDDFETWYATLSLKPTIDQIKEKFEKINTNEIKNFKNKLTEEKFNAINVYGESLQKKYLQFIIKNLKSLTNNGEKLEYIEMVNNLFELNKNKHEKYN